MIGINNHRAHPHLQIWEHILLLTFFLSAGKMIPDRHRQQDEEYLFQNIIYPLPKCHTIPPLGIPKHILAVIKKQRLTEALPKADDMVGWNDWLVCSSGAEHSRYHGLAIASHALDALAVELYSGNAYPVSYRGISPATN